MRKQATKLMLRYVIALALLVPIVVAARAEVTDLGRTRTVADTKLTFEPGDTMAFHVAGRLPIKSPAPNRLAATGELRSLATGELVGDMTWDLTCFHAVGVPCGHYEVVATFRLPGGTLVNKAMASAVPDPGHPDSFLIGIHPEGKSIAEATGVFARRTGKAHQSGFHGCKECPNFVTFDDFWLIELDPR